MKIRLKTYVFSTSFVICNSDHAIYTRLYRAKVFKLNLDVKPETNGLIPNQLRHSKHTHTHIVFIMYIVFSEQNNNI